MRSMHRLVAFACGLVLIAACGNPHLAGGKLHFDQQRFEQAEENFQMAVDSQPENGEAYMFLAMAKGELGKHTEAAANFKTALEFAPRLEQNITDNRDHYFGELFNSALAFNEKAEEFAESEDEANAKENYMSAIDELQKAMIYKPESPEAHRNMGVTYFKVGEVEKAMATFEKLESFSSDEDTKALLHTVYSGQGNDAFQKALNAREEENPDESVKHLDTALTLYTKAMALNPEDIDTAQNRAAVAWELADADESRKAELLAEARKGYESVLEVEPDNTEVIYNLSLLTQAAGDLEAALDYSSKLVDSDPKNGRYHINRGRIHGSLEDNKAMFGDLLIGQALDSGQELDPAQARTFAEAHGPRSQQLDRYREFGDPDEIRKFVDTGGSAYEVWFYWERGKSYAFQGGKEIHVTSFAPVPAGSGE